MIDRQKEEKRIDEFLRKIGLDIRGMIVALCTFRRQSVVNALLELPPFAAVNGRMYPIHPKTNDTPDEIAARLVAAANPDPVGVAARVMGQIIAPNPNHPFRARLPPSPPNLLIGGRPRDQNFRNLVR